MAPSGDILQWRSAWSLPKMVGGAAYLTASDLMSRWLRHQVSPLILVWLVPTFHSQHSVDGAECGQLERSGAAPATFGGHYSLTTIY